MSGDDPLHDESESIDDMHAPGLRVGEVHVTCQATSKLHFRGFGLKASHVVEREFANFPDGDEFAKFGSSGPWDEVIWDGDLVVAVILGRTEGKPLLVWVRDEATGNILIG